MSARESAPPLEFDGALGVFWYLRWYDPTDDICCAQDCRQAIDEDDVPLILFRRRGKETHQTRLHMRCAERLGLLRNLR